MKAYEIEWGRLCFEHEGCAHAAWQEVSAVRADGTDKTEQEYYEDLIWICEGIIASGGAEGC